MVASSDTGIELNDTNAPRQSRNVTSSSTTTSTAPISSELRSFAIALSMKLAGLSSAAVVLHPTQRQFRRQRSRAAAPDRA